MASRLVTLAQGSVATANTAVRVLQVVPDTVTKVIISAGSVDIWLGDINVAVNRGINIKANTIYSLYAQDDVFALDALWVNAAAAATFSVSYLTRT